MVDNGAGSQLMGTGTLLSELLRFPPKITLNGKILLHLEASYYF